MSSLNLLIFAASRRDGSYNRMLAKTATSLIANDHHTQELDYETICPPIFDERLGQGGGLPPEVEAFLVQLKRADALIISSPEYNWSMPGSLKTLLDWISLVRPYPVDEMPVLLMSASPSRRGGLLGLTQLRLPLEAMGALVYPQMFTLSQAAMALNSAGDLTDPALRQELGGILQRFTAMVSAQKQARVA